MAKKKKYVNRHGYFNKTWVVDRLSEKCDFNKSDVRIFLQGFEDLIAEVIEKRQKLQWRGIFSLEVIDVEGYEGWDGFSKKKIIVPKGKRVLFTPSPILRRLGDELHWDDGELDDEEL